MSDIDPAPPAPRQEARRSIFVDTTPLRESPAFARLWFGNSVAGIGTMITVVAVGLQVYDITHSTFAVSLVAGVSLVPMIVFGIYGGMLADVFDRRLISLISAVVAWASTAGICLMAWLHWDNVWALYVLTAVNTVAATVLNSARSAIIPHLIRLELLPAATALSGISVGLMVTVGPAIAGVLVAAVGFGPAYTIDVVTFSFAFLGILSLPRVVPEGNAGRPGLESLKEGMRFLRAAPNIRMSFIVDIIAMTFGQPRVLFPAVGALVIGGGAVTVGVLTAAYAAGGLLSSILSGPLGRVRMQGRAVARAIEAYGLSIALFGVVVALMSTGWFGPVGTGWDQVNLPALVLASAALVLAGGTDNISAIFRSTILQAAAPDSMRGRIQAVFTVVVTGGPRVGDLYVGAMSAFGVLWLPPVVGGIVIVAAILVLTMTQRSFLAYDAKHPTA